MKKALCIISVLLCILLTACGDDSSIGIIGGVDGPTSIIVSEKGEKAMYEQITAEEAKKIMDSGEEHIILDTREQDEFDEGHIPNAILIPYTEIENKAEEMLTDKVMAVLINTPNNPSGVAYSEETVKKLADILNSGRVIVAHMGPGVFTEIGHYIVIAGYEDGKFRVNDPNSYVNSEKLWEFEEFSNQIKMMWSFDK